MLQQIKKFCWQWRGVILATPSITGLVLLLRFAKLLQPLELMALDQFFLLRPIEPPDTRIVVVAIDDVDIQRTRQWPISDALLAKLLNKVKQQQPRAIGLDIYRDLPVEPGHQELVKVFESTPNLIGIRKVVSNTARLIINAPPVLEERGQVAANDFVLDDDGYIRRNLLSVVDREEQTIPALGSLLALLYLETEGFELKTDDNESRMTLGKTTFVSLQPNDGGYVQADTGGYQIIANFRNLRQGFRTVSLIEVLEDRIPQDLFRDRIVLIGTTADSIGDFFSTPYSRGIRSKDNRFPGVFIHADVASQLVASAIEGRSFIHPCPEWQEWLWIFACSFVGALLSWSYRYPLQSSKQIPGLIARLPQIPIRIALAGGGLTALSYWAFLQGIWTPVVPSLLALTGAAIAVTGYTARQVSSMRQLFGRYLTEPVVAMLLEVPESLFLGGERRQATILMSDLRGFSAMSERMSPEQVVAIINDYLAVMTEVIDQYQGVINEFLGDGVMVMFGVPIAGKDDAERAVACAIAMQLAMEKVNQRHRQQGLPLLAMGIGINTGLVVAGNVGSLRRTKYTVMGTPVNLASRIESLTVGGQILISQETLEVVGPIVRIDRELIFQPKGSRESITVYQISKIEGLFNLHLPDKGEHLTVLSRAIDFRYVVLEGKQVPSLILKGSLTKLSTHVAEIKSQYPLNLFTNLKLSLFIKSETYSEVDDLYAKVTEMVGDRTYHIHFTAVPPDAVKVLEELRTAESIGDDVGKSEV